jgi:hypothetical protein
VVFDTKLSPQITTGFFETMGFDLKVLLESIKTRHWGTAGFVPSPSRKCWEASQVQGPRLIQEGMDYQFVQDGDNRDSAYESSKECWNEEITSQQKQGIR